MTAPLLTVRHVMRHYAMGGLFGRGLRAVDDVSFEVGATGPQIVAPCLPPQLPESCSMRVLKIRTSAAPGARRTYSR